MHLPLLLKLSLFSFVLPSLGSSADILYIQKSVSDFTLISDSGSISGVPDFSTFDKVFTNNATFDFDRLFDSHLKTACATKPSSLGQFESRPEMNKAAKSLKSRWREALTNHAIFAILGLGARFFA